MEWCLVGLDTMPMVSENDTSMITLTLDSYSGLNGTRFGCRVTLPDAAPLQRNVTIVVKGMCVCLYIIIYYYMMIIYT